MKQPHTEQDIRHTDDQQNTGNHHTIPMRGGGTRAGAQNVETVSDKASSVEKGTDIDKVPSLDGTDPGTKTDTSRERSPERDEHGRM